MGMKSPYGEMESNHEEAGTFTPLSYSMEPDFHRIGVGEPLKGIPTVAWGDKLCSSMLNQLDRRPGGRGTSQKEKHSHVPGSKAIGRGQPIVTEQRGACGSEERLEV